MDLFCLKNMREITLFMEWKRQSRRDIEGYEGLYQVSYLGRVKSLLRIVADRRGMPHYVNERILKQIDENKSNNIVLVEDKPCLIYGQFLIEPKTWFYRSDEYKHTPKNLQIIDLEKII